MNSVILQIEAKIRTDPFNPLHHIALARAYLDEGDEEKARRVIAIKRKLPSKDPVAHFEWGKLCEELGMAQQARDACKHLPGDGPFRVGSFCQRGRKENRSCYSPNHPFRPEGERCFSLLNLI